MGKSVSDGLARLRIESRIPATTWRQWCNLLEMHPDDAIDVWEEICPPIMVANRKVPEIPYILQLRSGRPELDIYEFKEECAKVLYLSTFLFNLEDDRLTKGKIKSALLRLYKSVSSRLPATGSDHTNSSKELQAYFAEQPLAFDVEAKGDGAEIPAEILKPSDLGEVFDTTAKYLCTQAWSVMEAVHGPKGVVNEIIANLREWLIGCVRFQPERKRHQDNPRLSLRLSASTRWRATST